jgi:prevent-host-death family protein
MIEAMATATEIKNHFGKYLQMVINGNEVIVTKNGQEVGRFVPKGKTASYLTDSLAGILKGDYDYKDAKEEALREKYESID